MRRRAVIAGLAAASFCSAQYVRAQQRDRSATVGYLAPRRNERLLDAFVAGLRDLGYDQSRNLTLLYRSADGRAERLVPLAADLVAIAPDVVVTLGATAAHVVARATSTIPVVFAPAGDAVATGLVQSLARPGGNVTGLSLNTWILNSKRLEVLKENFPTIRRVAVLGNANNPSALAQWQESKAAGSALNLDLLLVLVDGANDLPTGFSRITQEGVDALAFLADAEFDAARQHVVSLATQYGSPAIYEHRAFVEAGGLMSYGPNLDSISRRAATFVDRIIKGDRPAELPVEEPTTFELMVNLKTAKALGLTIQPTLLARADEVIE